MNTVCKILDIDIYLITYLDFKTICNLLMISKTQYSVMFTFDFINELYLLKQKYAVTIFNIIDLAAQYNYLSLIKQIDRSSSKFYYTVNAIDMASAKEYIDILDWFDKSNHEFKYTTYAINAAAMNNSLKTLQWFHESKYDFNYTYTAIDMAAAYGFVSVLEWFKKSGYRLRYTWEARRLGNKNINTWLDEYEQDMKKKYKGL